MFGSKSGNLAKYSAKGLLESKQFVPDKQPIVASKVQMGSASSVRERGEERVRLALARGSADPQILEYLVQDDERSVRRAAAERLEVLEPAKLQRADTSYRMAHRAPVKDEDGYSSAADLTVMLPSDVYDQMDLYMGAVNLPGRREIRKQLLAARGNPDALVTIFGACHPSMLRPTAATG